MTSHLFQSLMGLLLPTLILGCALTPAPPPGLPTGTTSPAATPPLRFGSPSLDAVQALNHVPPLLSGPAGEDPARPLAPMWPHAQSGNVGTEAAYGLDALMGRSESVFTVQGLPFRRSLTAFQEAFLPGHTGPFVRLRATLLQPIVDNWASDATLVRANVSKEELNGSETPPTFICGPSYGMPWDLVYVSASRQEALRFLVREHRIQVLRLQWQRPGSDMPTPNVPLTGVTTAAWPPMNREAAIQRLVAALRTSSAVSQEEHTRSDHFHSQPHAEPSYYADQAPGLDPGPIFEVPSDTSWDAALQSILGRWVWVIREADPTPPTSPGGFRVLCTTAPGEPRLVTRKGLYGMVDAERGEVIRFVRSARRIERPPGL